MNPAFVPIPSTRNSDFPQLFNRRRAALNKLRPFAFKALPTPQIAGRSVRPGAVYGASNGAHSTAFVGSGACRARRDPAAERSDRFRAGDRSGGGLLQ